MNSVTDTKNINKYNSLFLKNSHNIKKYKFFIKKSIFFFFYEGKERVELGATDSFFDHLSATFVKLLTFHCYCNHEL